MLVLECPPPPARPRRKPRDRYHHGDLRRALLDEALRTIQHEGVEALTLRTIGLRLGVSRTALYRHFADKRALLSAVATEGFRMLRERLVEAWGAGGVRGFNATGVAYIRFAMANPSHYRVMFGGFVDRRSARRGTDARGDCSVSDARRLPRRTPEGRRRPKGGPFTAGPLHLGRRPRDLDAHHRRPAPASTGADRRRSFSSPSSASTRASQGGHVSSRLPGAASPSFQTGSVPKVPPDSRSRVV